jgi:hypothetical protein
MEKLCDVCARRAYASWRGGLSDCGCGICGRVPEPLKPAPYVIPVAGLEWVVFVCFVLFMVSVVLTKGCHT